MKNTEVENTRSPYRAIGDKCRLSERTIRTAFSGKPVTWQTACRIANALGIDVREFRIKADNRGRRQRAASACRGGWPAKPGDLP